MMGFSSTNTTNNIDVIEGFDKVGVIYKHVDRTEWLFFPNGFRSLDGKQLKQISKKLKELNKC